MLKLLLAGLLFSGSVWGQVPQRTLEECKILSYEQAKYVMRMRMFKIPEDQIRGRPTANTPVLAVRNLMIHLTDKYPKITESELATEGYSYCVSRR